VELFCDNGWKGSGKTVALYGWQEFLSKAIVSGILFMLINVLSLVNYAMEDIIKESEVPSLI
jgi:hypothetical protein